MTGIATRGNLLGDMFGLRTILGDYGITLNANEVSEVLGNVSGGFSRGVTYDGLTTMSLGGDLDQAFGWTGATFNISALQIHGRSESANYLGNLQTVSGIEADRATRIWELWVDQAFLDGAVDVKIGQQSLDQEFIVSAGSALYLNTMAGWPMIPSADLYAGGPAYPLSSLGARVKVNAGAFIFLGGVFDDNPPGGPFDNDPQERDADGARFNLNTGVLIIGEIQYARDQPVNGQMDYGTPATGLPGTFKLGFWYDTATFQDQRYDTNGVSLAGPASNGIPRGHKGNFSIYGVADQTVWQPDPFAPQSLSIFTRVMGAPADQNLIDFSINAGMNLKGPLPYRDDDTFGIGFGVAKVSGRAKGLDEDTARLSPPYPTRSTETFLEVTYQYTLFPWWQIQPDFQYTFNPGAGIPDPNDATQTVGDEAVFGARTTITF